jgi:hypothetical protein
MLRYDDFVKLARCYAEEARKAQKQPERARDWWRLALYYQSRAATGGEQPDIGEKPSHL